jgi:glycosyltransferase involved in cell wall biosynthesis
MKLYEYLAMGLTVVAPDKPTVRDVVTHNRNAFLFAPDDRQALVSALGTVIDGDELRVRLSANVLAERQHIGWDVRARTLVSAIETALARSVSATAGQNRAAGAGAVVPAQSAVAKWERLS